MTTDRYPLSGVRVLDLSTEIAGPYATKMLVDAGADVIKVEPPEGDPLRRWSSAGHPIEPGDSSGVFKYLNASKRSIVIDLEDAAGRAELLDLAASADLVFESFRPADAERRGITLEALQARNPALTLVSITPWGRTGPWANRPWTEFTLQAQVGSTAYRGLPSRGPVAAGGRLADWLPGGYAAEGALSAWLSARKTGRGQHVDLSMFECLVLSMTVYHDLNSQFVAGRLPQSIELPSIEPARDGWVGFCTITGQQWRDFCALIGRPDIGDDDQYLVALRRMEHIDRMQEAFWAWTRERTIDEIIELASLMRIPIAPIGDGKTLPAMDQMVERKVFVTSPHGFTQPRVPFRLSRTAPRPFGLAPALDEHAAEVRAELASARPSIGATEGGGPRPLEGIRVVDLSAFWAGPIAASYFADMGADVVKIESIQRPDGMRFAGAAPKEPIWEWCPIWHGANTGKRGITLRLDDDRGMDLVKRLIRDADIVIENFSVRVLENFGLTWDVVHALNPRAIMVRMPAFGLEGPWRDRAGFAMTIEQVSGLAWVTGYPDLPMVPRGALDPFGGANAVFATLLALEHRCATGEGQLVEVPLIEAAVNISAEQVIEYSQSGTVLGRSGNRGPLGAPQGVYPTASEDPLAISIATDAQWRALRVALGSPEWARDPALNDVAGRRAAHDAIDDGLRAWLSSREVDDAAELLTSAGVPAAVVINAHEIFGNPQLEHRRFFQTMDHPVTGPLRYPGLPMGFSVLDNHHPCPPPTLGQHNEEVLSGELGLSDAEIEALREAKIIGNRPSFM